MVSRRTFTRIIAASTVVTALNPTRVFSSPKGENAEFETAYPDMPRIDAHVHIGRNTNANIKNYLGMREQVLKECKADLAIWLDLDGGTTGYADGVKTGGLERLITHGDAKRMIPTITDWRPANGLSYTKTLIESRFRDGYIGYKWHLGTQNKATAKYPYVDNPYFDPFYDFMQGIRMPLASLHLEGNWYESGGHKKQRESIVRVMKKFPELIVIHAHMGAHRWDSLQEQSEVMDNCPNYYRDVSVTIQHSFKENYNDFRNFFIKYSDRLLFGTDRMLIENTTQIERNIRLYKSHFEFYETANTIKSQDVGVNYDDTPEFLQGICLPREVLEKIYYKNALRVYPQMIDYMKEIGYAELVTNVNSPKMHEPKVYMSDDVLIIKGLPQGVKGEIYSPSGRKVASLPSADYEGTIIWITSEISLPRGFYIVNLRDSGKRNYYSCKVMIAGDN